MKKTHFKTYIILTIFISIIGISIAYAALNQQLQIKTSTTVQSSQTSWNISYQKQTCSVRSGYVKLGTMSVNNTTVTLSDFVFQAPESSVYCQFNVINSGELNAKISSLNYTEPTFTGSGTSKTTDEAIIKNNFSISARWVIGGNWPVVRVGDTISSGETKSICITFGFLDSEMNTLPTNSVTISNATYTINFEQA